MKLINYISSAAMPMVILIILLYGITEKQKVFDLFVDGAKSGLKIVLKIFPTLIGLFVAIGALRSSGIIDLIINILMPILNLLKIPSEIMPLAMLRPVSGSASMAIATDIMKNFGVDSNIGVLASVIMGSTETTLYTIAVYSSAVGIKKTRFVLFAALCADVAGILASVVICRILSWSFYWQILRQDVLYIYNLFQKEVKMLIKILEFISIFLIVKKIIIKILSKNILKKIS